MLLVEIAVHIEESCGKEWKTPAQESSLHHQCCKRAGAWRQPEHRWSVQNL